MGVGGRSQAVDAAKNNKIIIIARRATTTGLTIDSAPGPDLEGWIGSLAARPHLVLSCKQQGAAGRCTRLDALYIQDLLGCRGLFFKNDRFRVLVCSD